MGALTHHHQQSIITLTGKKNYRWHGNQNWKQLTLLTCQFPKSMATKVVSMETTCIIDLPIPKIHGNNVY
jgi:predicted chitinase